MTTKSFTVVCQLSLLTLLYGTPGLAQGRSSEEVSDLTEENDLTEEIEALKAGQKAIQRELQEIKSLLRTRQAPAPAPTPREFVLDLGGSPFKGDENAKLTLVEFTDYQ